MDKRLSGLALRSTIRRIPKGKVFFTTLIVFLAVAGGLIWFSLSLLGEQSKDDSITLVPLSEIQDNVTHFTEKGDTDGALGFYDKQAELRQDKGEKQQVLIMKARFAQGADRMDAALDAAKRADSFGSNSRTLITLAEVYAARGDNDRAIEYYKKIRDTSPSSDNVRHQSQGPTLEDKIKELEQ